MKILVLSMVIIFNMDVSESIILKEIKFIVMDELHFLDAGWVYHFNAIPQNRMDRQVDYWMERTYRELYE